MGALRRWASLIALAIVGCGDDAGGGNASGGGSPSMSTGGTNAAAGSRPAGGSASRDAAIALTADCASVEDWDPASQALEDELLALLNEQRAGAGGCPPADAGTLEPLSMHERLRCSARLHAKDMATRDFFGTVNPDDQNTAQRIMSTGYGGTRLAESVGRGQTATDLARADSVCTYVTSAVYSEVGVGHFAADGGTSYWTIDFGG
jgi:uncharacterized protein YkwD